MKVHVEVTARVGFRVRARVKVHVEVTAKVGFRVRVSRFGLGGEVLDCKGPAGGPLIYVDPLIYVLHVYVPTHPMQNTCHLATQQRTQGRDHTSAPYLGG